MKKIICFLCVLGDVPAIALAQETESQSSDLEAVTALLRILFENVIPLLFLIAISVFFWGLVQLIASAGDQGAASSGKNLMIAGVVALLVMSSVWGILAFIGYAVG
ncbi:MAG: hypothetical protein A2928_02455 [Candidatus Taylorbacteria bacterium RIFCSPLOWO2_01_FULL_45_15b]|uniref:Uncharacterized protein n=1 Tax=Candidatus Taylorbacteria bacterium RIFCSPLOWO2_01_FULL_45_15b TaxID=1802319 RepID=A0A1G2NCW7_9BACT|nr:MAG: hypothetical protein A2928_02455 [Candidatus Taylorbacteria bacterium RIFCSPLOWO2_01_FULL_45_15b]